MTNDDRKAKKEILSSAVYNFLKPESAMVNFFTAEDILIAAGIPLKEVKELKQESDIHTKEVINKFVQNKLQDI